MYKILLNPFLTGIAVGFLSGNIPLAMVSCGLTLLLWGTAEGKNYIIVSTILLVTATGNINFEIILIYFLSIAWLIKILINDDSKKHGLLLITSIISVMLFPLWKYILGLVPAQVLNEFNIAGEILLLAAVVLNLQRGIKKKKGRIKFLLYTFLAGIGIMGNIYALPCWIVGTVLLYYLESKEIYVPVVDKIYYSILFLMSILFVYILIPLSITILTLATLLIIFIYLRGDRTVLIETVYLSLLTGLIAGRIGLLN